MDSSGGSEGLRQNIRLRSFTGTNAEEEKGEKLVLRKTARKNTRGTN